MQSQERYKYFFEPFALPYGLFRKSGRPEPQPVNQRKARKRKRQGCRVK